MACFGNEIAAAVTIMLLEFGKIWQKFLVESEQTRSKQKGRKNH